MATTAPITNPAASVPSGAVAAAGVAPAPVPVIQAYDPENTQPYQPAQLPDVDQASQPIAAALPKEQPIQDLGATTHTGGAAYIGDQLLRGVMQGVALHQMNSAVKLHRTSVGLQSNLDAASRDLYAVAKSGADPKKSPEYQQALDRVYAAWQPMMDFYGAHVPGVTIDKKTGQPKPAKKSILDRLKGNDPAEVSAAVYEAMLKAGPPVLHQIAQFLTPQYRQYVAGQGELAQTQQGLGIATAQAAEQKAHLEQTVYSLSALAHRTPEQEEQLQSGLQALHNLSRPIEEWRTDKDANGKWYKWKVDEFGNEIQNTRQPLSMAGLTARPPVVGSFGDFMAAGYGPHPTAAQYIAGRKLWYQATSSMTIGTHDITVPQLDGSIKLVQVQTTSQKVVPGTGSLPTTRQDQTGGAVPVTAPTSAPTPRSVSTVHSTVTPSNGRPKPGDIVGGHQTPEMVKANETFQALDSSYNAMRQDAAKLDPASSYALAVEFAKAQNTGGTGTMRLNEAEIKRVNDLGSLAQRFVNAWNRGTRGTLPQNIAQDMLQVVKRKRDAWYTTAHEQGKLPGSSGAAAPPPATEGYGFKGITFTPATAGP